MIEVISMDFDKIETYTLWWTNMAMENHNF